MMIDAHTHLGLETFVVRPLSEEKKKKPAFKDRMHNEPATLVAALDRNGVDKAVAFPFPLAEVDRDVANAYVLAAAAEYPTRIIPFALVGDDVEASIAQGARGFKQHFLLEPDRFDLRRAYQAIEAAGLPLIVHLVTHAVIEGVEAILREAPGMRLIVAHMGRCEPNTGKCVEENLNALAVHNNVYFETSTVRDERAFRLAIDILGPDRVCFGSDFPFNSYADHDPLRVELDAVDAAGFPAEIREKVFGGNIISLLGG